MEAAAVPCMHLRSAPANACKRHGEHPKWYCALTANALQPGFKKKACDAPYLASSCELGHMLCDRLRLECRCGAFRSWTGWHAKTTQEGVLQGHAALRMHLGCNRNAARPE